MVFRTDNEMKLDGLKIKKYHHIKNTEVKLLKNEKYKV